MLCATLSINWCTGGVGGLWVCGVCQSDVSFYNGIVFIQRWNDCRLQLRKWVTIPVLLKTCYIYFSQHLIIYLINYSGNYNGEKPYVSGASCSSCPGGYSCSDNLCVDGSDSTRSGSGTSSGSGSGDSSSTNTETTNTGYGDVPGKINSANWISKKATRFTIIVITLR